VSGGRREPRGSLRGPAAPPKSTPRARQRCEPGCGCDADLQSEIKADGTRAPCSVLGQTLGCCRGHRLPCRLGKQAAGTGVDNRTISYLPVTNKLHLKEFHPQHPTKLVPSKTTQVLVRVPLPQPRGSEGSEQPRVRGLVGWDGGCALLLTGEAAVVFRVLEESGVAGSGCPGAGELLLVSVEAEDLRGDGQGQPGCQVTEVLARHGQPRLPKIMKNPALGWESGWGGAEKSRSRSLAPEPSCFAFADFPVAARVRMGRTGKCHRT